MIGTLLWALIGGAFIGTLGKWAAPGDRKVPLWLTILCGVGGMLLGNWLYVGVFNFKADTGGIDWWRHVWQVAVAAILVVAASSLRTKRRTA
jgi:uncharacterized membrane protein YeaQ/YmgE (transglycosylase-associated protein family)